MKKNLFEVAVMSLSKNSGIQNKLYAETADWAVAVANYKDAIKSLRVKGHYDVYLYEADMHDKADAIISLTDKDNIPYLANYFVKGDRYIDPRRNYGGGHKIDPDSWDG